MKKLELLFILLFLSSFCIFFCIKETVEPNVTTEITINIDYADYEICISKLKQFEGFSSKVYVCPGGYKTIGYGLPYSVWKKNIITEHEADSCLRLSFNNQIKKAYEISKYSGRKLLALAMLISNLKHGSVESSSLLKIEDKEASWKSFNKANGKIQGGLKNRRDWEYEFYNSK